MANTSDEFVKTLLKDRTLKLEYLHEEHRIAIAVYEAKRQMLLSDVTILEKHIQDA